MACGMLMGGDPFRGTWAALMAFPFSSRSLAWGGPEAEGRGNSPLLVGRLCMGRKMINEFCEQVWTASAFLSRFMFSCTSFVLLNHAAAVNAGAPFSTGFLSGERMRKHCRANNGIFPAFAYRPHLPGRGK